MAAGREVRWRWTESVMAVVDRECDGGGPSAGIVGRPRRRGLYVGRRRKAMREAGWVSAGWSLA
jgi:hypothetical protein